MEIHGKPNAGCKVRTTCTYPPVLQAEPHKTGGTLNFLCRHSQSYCVRAKSQPPHSPTLTYPTIDCSSTAPAVDTSTLWPSWWWRCVEKNGIRLRWIGSSESPYQGSNFQLQFQLTGKFMKDCDWSKVKVPVPARVDLLIRPK